MTSRRLKLALIIVCLKELWFFIIPIRVRKILGNQIVFTPSTKAIPFSKYLSFHLGVVLVHANCANLALYTWEDLSIKYLLVSILIKEIYNRLES